MHPIRVVHNLYPVVSLLTVTALGLSISAQQSAPQVLDLTKPPPREQQETGLPGMSIGGIEGQPLPTGYRLPLKIELTSINPQRVRLGDKFTVEVRLRNVSAVVFFLPASQNSAEVFRHEGKGRRRFDFNFILEDPTSGHQISKVAAVAAGSDTMDGSLLRIEPGGEVSVLFTADLRSIAPSFGQDGGRILVRAGVSETAFEDRRYFVERKSEEIETESVQTIDLVKR